jgi:uncharacterized membrane protein
MPGKIITLLIAILLIISLSCTEKNIVTDPPRQIISWDPPDDFSPSHITQDDDGVFLGLFVSKRLSGKDNLWVVQSQDSAAWVNPLMIGNIYAHDSLSFKVSNDSLIISYLGVSSDLAMDLGLTRQEYPQVSNNWTMIFLIDSLTLDSDKDGIPDNIEYELLSEISNTDSDSDGKTDDQDFNPLTRPMNQTDIHKMYLTTLKHIISSSLIDVNNIGKDSIWSEYYGIYTLSEPAPLYVSFNELDSVPEFKDLPVPIIADITTDKFKVSSGYDSWSVGVIPHYNFREVEYAFEKKQESASVFIDKYLAGGIIEYYEYILNKNDNAWQVTEANKIEKPEKLTKQPLIYSNIGVLMALAMVCAFFFFLEKKTKWKVFNSFPPLLFIYLTPMLLSNTGVIPYKSEVFSFMSDAVLPLFLVMMMLDVNVRGTIRVMGKGIFVMLFGTLGVVVGAPIGYAIVSGQLNPEVWKGFGALAGSWIGGTGNMAAVADGLGTSGSDYGLAALADNVVYLVWLPIMLNSKKLAKWFNKFTGASADRVKKMEQAAKEITKDKGRMQMRHILYLLAIGFAVTFLASQIAKLLPEFPPILSVKTWRILLVTTLALACSFTPAKNIPGSHPLAMALIYLFVANMGAKAHVGQILGQAPWFILGAYVWVFIHGGFCLLGAKIFKVDVHTAAICSAANIGGAASAPVVAAYHKESLVPVSILMALIGYAIGTYAAFGTAQLCYWVSTIL